MIELSIRKALAGSFATATELHVQHPRINQLHAVKFIKKEISKD